MSDTVKAYAVTTLCYTLTGLTSGSIMLAVLLTIIGLGVE